MSPASDSYHEEWADSAWSTKTRGEGEMVQKSRMEKKNTSGGKEFQDNNV